MKGFWKVNRVQNLNHIRLMHYFSGFVFQNNSVFIPFRWSLCQHLSALFDQSAFRIGDDHGTVHLHDWRLHKKTGFSGTTATDDHDIFISGIFRLFWSALHGQCFCRSQRDIHPGIIRHVRLDILCRPPSGWSILDSFSELFGICPFLPDQNL